MVTRTPIRRRGLVNAISLLLLVTTGVACARPRPRLDPVPASSTRMRVQLSDGTRILSIELEDYIVGSILAEADVRGLDAVEADRVARVQAILARTYAVFNRGRHAHEGFDLCATTHCQVYRPVDTMSAQATSVAASAARATRGLVVSYDGQPINAVYHADCGGSTSAATVAWGGAAPPYLRGVRDPFCQRNDPEPWRFEIDRTALLDALRTDSRTRVGPELHDILIAEQDQSGRVVRAVILGNETTAEVRGEDLRSLLSQHFGPHSIKSTRFTVQRLADRFIFEGRGFGHGVGLCQRGAVERARSGHTPQTIISHYYPGTSLTQYY